MKANSLAVEDYISPQTLEIQVFFEKLRRLIQQELPEAREGIAWKMPSYWQGTYLVHFQAFKSHVNLYVGPEAVAHFQESYPGLEFTGRGIRLSYQEPLPEEALRNILDFQYQTFVTEKKI